MFNAKIVLVLILSVFITSCSDDEPAPDNSVSTFDNSVSTFAGPTVGCTSNCPDNYNEYDPAKPSEGGHGYVNGKLNDAIFGAPTVIAMSPDEKFLFTSELYTMNIRKIDIEKGTISTIAGNGYGCTTACPGDPTPGHQDGSAELAKFMVPTGMVFNEDGTIMYLAEAGNSDIRMIALDTDSGIPMVSTIAGSPTKPGYVNGPLLKSQFNVPQGMAFDRKNNNIYVADMLNKVVRKIDLTAGEVSTFAGAPPECTTDCSGYVNAVGAEARFEAPLSIVIDNQGENLFLTDVGNSVIRRIKIATAEVSTFIGALPDVSRENDAITMSFCSVPPVLMAKRNSGYANGHGIHNPFCTTGGLTIDGENNLYMTDLGSKTIRKIDVVGTITTLAGAGVDCTDDCPFDFTQTGMTGDAWESTNGGYINGSKANARFNGPSLPVINKAGTVLYVPDSGVHVIRKIVP